MRLGSAARALGMIMGLVLSGGCPGTAGGEIDEADCPEDSDLTYDNFGQAFLAANCQICHASDVSDRHGAPEAYTFDTLEDIHDLRDRIFARAAGDNTSMPPGPEDPPAEERELLAEWLSCGAP